MLDLNESVELLDCPRCHGVGVVEEENGWCVYVSCLDCGCHTAEVGYNTPEERLEAAKTAASRWNIGKVISSEPDE
ncbi:MAG: Lar family restriction alleviation protein [Sphaerochaetaceae bacterium]|nr:Lar family restriction alleviation protein [Sphaerochaetaceae bacterium]